MLYRGTFVVVYYCITVVYKPSGIIFGQCSTQQFPF